ncbi:MAG: CBS domain-containing protein [Candidatus Heimdallarchaeota archaeon]
MRVKDIMTKEVICCEVPGTRDDLLQLIRDYKHLGYPCVKAGTKELVGIITRTDLLEKPDETQIALLMTRDPITLPPEADVKEAVHLLVNKRIRRIPVTTNRELLALLTINDVVGRVVAPSGLETEIGGIMTKKVTAVWQETPLNVLSTILRLARVAAVPVLDEHGKMVGMVGLDDILRLAEEIASASTSTGTATGEFHTGSWDAIDVIKIEQKILKLPPTPIKEIMTPGVVSAFESSTVAQVAQKMRRYDFSQLPVTNAHGHLIGMIYDRQIIEAYARSKL